MVSNILDRVPGIIGRVMRDRVFRSAILHMPGETTGSGVDPTQGEPTPHNCQALEDSWSTFSLSSGLVAQAERKIMILAASIPGIEPVEGATITMHDGKVFSFVSEGGSGPAVTTDPAKAIWVCRGRA